MISDLSSIFLDTLMIHMLLMYYTGREYLFVCVMELDVALVEKFDLSKISIYLFVDD